MIDDEQLGLVLSNLQVLSNKLAMEGRFMDATAAAGGLQSIRALRTMAGPPVPAAAPDPQPEPAPQPEPGANP